MFERHSQHTLEAPLARWLDLAELASFSRWVSELAGYRPTALITIAS